MPFDIEAFKSSSVVQAMRPAGRAGYLYLLAEMWQSSDCTLSADDEDLMIASGLGEEWLEHRRLIMRKLELTDSGRLTNSVLSLKWHEAKRIFEARQKAAKDTASVRSSHGDHAVTEQSPGRPADTTTGTVTSTKTEVQKPLASSDKKPSLPAIASPAFMAFPVTKPKDGTYIVTEGQIQDWTPLYPAVDIRQEIRTMRGWIDGNPTRMKTHSGVPAFIHRWLARAQNTGGSSGISEGKNGSNPSSSGSVVRPANTRNNFLSSGKRLGPVNAADGANGGLLSAPGVR